MNHLHGGHWQTSGVADWAKTTESPYANGLHKGLSLQAKWRLLLVSSSQGTGWLADCEAALQDIIKTADRQLAETQLFQALQLAAPSVRELRVRDRPGYYEGKVQPALFG